jgi:xanthine dehydrogenase/oxidase
VARQKEGISLIDPGWPCCLPGTYKIPGFNDIPQVFNVSLLREAEWPNLGTIASSKGVGEPPLFLGATVAFAIRDALASARRDAGVHELQPFRSPLTSERTRLAVGDDLLRRGTVIEKKGQQSFFAYI